MKRRHGDVMSPIYRIQYHLDKKDQWYEPKMQLKCQSSHRSKGSAHQIRHGSGCITSIAGPSRLYIVGV